MTLQTWVFDLTNLWGMDEIFFRDEKLARTIDQKTYEYLTSFVEKFWDNSCKVVEKIWETYICKTREWLEIQIIKNYKWTGNPAIRISKDIKKLTRIVEIEEMLKTNSSIPMHEWVDPIDMIESYMLALYSLWERKFLEKHRAPIAPLVNDILHNKTFKKSQEWELREFDFQSLANDEKDKSMEIFHGHVDGLPEYKVQVDQREFLLTKQYIFAWRKYILGATKVNGLYESRLFYFSQSGGNWHCTPGIERSSGTISKAWFLWISYEKWTVVSSKLSEAFDSLDLSPRIDYNVLSDWEKNFGIIRDKEKQEFKLRYGDEFQTTKLYSDEKLFHLSRLPWNMTKDQLIDTFRTFRLPDAFDQSFSGGFTKGSSYIHDYLWRVHTVVGRTIFNGESIDVVFAMAEDNPFLVWVENICFANETINSYGIPACSISAGILTAKPVDYTDQIPNSIIYDSKRYYPPGVTHYSYTDIREYMQQNPLIVKFKELYRNEQNVYAPAQDIPIQPSSAIPTL